MSGVQTLEAFVSIYRRYELRTAWRDGIHGRKKSYDTQYNHTKCVGNMVGSVWSAGASRKHTQTGIRQDDGARNVSPQAEVIGVVAPTEQV
jgi:hypothetical protein